MKMPDALSSCLARALAVAIILFSAAAFAQNVFSSSSTGADGALTFAANSGVHVIDMAAKPDGVWNYTTINIPTGVVVRFQKNAANTPVVWLATGDVTVAGEVDLDGADSAASVAPGNEAAGGPGGFAGGLGGLRFDASGTYVGTPGQGPGGGPPGVSMSQLGGNAGHNGNGVNCQGAAAGVGVAYGNRLVRPLIGGSGGGGSASESISDGANGGGGGGAMLIASSSSVTIDGSLHANGGRSVAGATKGGSGSGGSIRIAANRIAGAGLVSADGGTANFCPGDPNGRRRAGAAGYIRLEAFSVDASMGGMTDPPAAIGPPLASNIAAEGQVRIARVAGQVVQNPAGSLNSPDIVFTAAGNITINLETTNIPVGTSLTVRITASGQVITVQSTPTDATGKATATAAVPAGVGTIQALAEYPPQS